MFGDIPPYAPSRLVATPRRFGDDEARVDWVMRTWRKRGLVYDDPRTAANQYIDEVGREKIDNAMRKAI